MFTASAMTESTDHLRFATLREIINQYKKYLQPIDNIEDYASLRSACYRKDLEESLIILQDFIDSDIFSLPDSFKLLAEQRRRLTQNTALSFLAAPKSLANQLYQEFFVI